MAAPTLEVAFSGGLDSLVLLHVLRDLAAEQGFGLSAVHVNHRLQPLSDTWEEACAALCADWGVRLRRERLAPFARGVSIEAEARRLRYACFARTQAQAVVLAHHQDDQAETLLLALVRGAGGPGLAAMPPLRPLQGALGPLLFRPLLGLQRRDLADYACQHGLSALEDPSNGDPRFDRNFLRQEILPRLHARFPGTPAALARSAAHCAQLQALAYALARIDAGPGLEPGRLALACLHGLDAGRAANLMRFWLGEAGHRLPRTAELAEALRQLKDARPERAPLVRLGDVWLRRRSGFVELVPAPSAPPEAWQLPWAGEATLDLPQALGRLHFAPVTGAGLRLASLRGALVHAGSRGGGEGLRPGPGARRRSLKNLLQEAQVPAWERPRLPLLFVGGQLAWVARVAQEWVLSAGPEEPGLELHWEAGAAASPA